MGIIHKLGVYKAFEYNVPGIILVSFYLSCMSVEEILLEDRKKRKRKTFSFHLFVAASVGKNIKISRNQDLDDQRVPDHGLNSRI